MLNASQKPIRCFIVDDYPLYVTMLEDLLKTDDRFVPLGVAHTGREALAALRLVKPDLVVLDLNLPDISGLELIRVIRAEQLAERIIVCSVQTSDETIEVAIALGADVFVEKSASVSDLLAALKAAAQDRFPMNEHVSRVLRRALQFRQSHNGPRPRDYSILLGLSSGQSVKTVATGLGLSVSAVYKARQRLAQRFALHRNAELNQLAGRLGVPVKPAAGSSRGERQDK